MNNRTYCAILYKYSMRIDRHRAIKLRIQGKSYNEIQRMLGGISKSTLSQWLSGLTLSQIAQERLAKRVKQKSLEGLLKRNRIQTHLAIQRMIKIQDEARAQVDNISLQNLFLSV